ncbi:MAG: hypothetical protein APR63_12085 [Desulfuromonas sp. SDB]|nr:MAG: hypothetical protein APR63_12085 [Desulfuromonas sp. SDB]
MKFFKILCVVFIILAVLLACGKGSGGNNEEQNSSADWPWEDIPLYSEAFNLEEYVDPGIRMKFDNPEGRTFDTDKDFETLFEFYLEEMPKHGWKPLSSMDPTNRVAIMKWESEDGKIYVEMVISTDPEGNARAMIARCPQN